MQKVAEIAGSVWPGKGAERDLLKMYKYLIKGEKKMEPNSCPWCRDRTQWAKWARGTN